jgi:hypothetical protein
MNSKTLNTFSILCLIAIVGVMSWRDMHPKADVNAVSALDMITYFAGPDITPAMIPNDNSRPVTISLGDFSYAPDDSPLWTPHGMPPTTFAQRQVNLQFNFKSLPQNPAKTIEKINTIAESWMSKGDTVNVLILDYRARKPDLKAYAALLKAAHDEFSRPTEKFGSRYTIYAGIDLLWAEGQQKDALKDFQDYAPQFLIHLPQTHISPELLSKLQAFKYNVILQFPAGTRVEDIDVATLKKIASLSSVTLTLDAHKPLPKKEEKIGLFPKL